MNHATDQIFDLAVIGTGMAGAAAAVFAANRGLSTAQVGQTGEIIFASGYLDLLGVFPPAEKKIWDDPWAGLERLKQDVPAHPLARIALPLQWGAELHGPDAPWHGEAHLRRP